MWNTNPVSVPVYLVGLGSVTGVSEPCCEALTAPARTKKTERRETTEFAVCQRLEGWVAPLGQEERGFGFSSVLCILCAALFPATLQV